MAAPFSRLQLAAALLEYDNDPDDPSAPYRSAQESAIFAHFRRNPARPAPVQRRSDFLGVSLPSETGSLGGRESALDVRKSRSSIALRNPFSPDDNYDSEHYDTEEHEEELEVDLSSWGLDAFMSKDKGAKGKGKAKSLPSAQPLSAVQSHFPQTNDVLGNVARRPKATRSMSVGNYDFLTTSDDTRRKSFASPLDLNGLDVPPSFRRPDVSLSSNPLPDPEPLTGSIPFPSASVRSPSPMLLDKDRQRRTYSTASADLMTSGHLRSPSTGAMDPAEDNPFALRLPSRASRFDPKAAAHARTVSNASLGSRMLLENDAASVMTGQGAYTRNTRYSTTMDLLRPKVLVMPSPLQSTSAPAPVEEKGREGFQLSTDGPPLPPGARSTRRASTFGLSAPVASNSFTPNPRANLTLSQLTFRNNLVVDGQRDIAYNDIDGDLPRATEDGQQIHLGPNIPEVEIPSELPIGDSTTPNRPAGKLYGKSLIDDLEDRKAKMRNKQRVFRGDDRPSMMARSTSTLIDPASLQARPTSQRMSSLGVPDSLGRRASANIKPLLNLEEDTRNPPRLSPGARIPSNRSVFGVDTLWEREMVKLREIEAQEAFERERQQAQEETDALRKGKDRKKKAKKGKEVDYEANDIPSSVHETPATESLDRPRVSADPPVLPNIPAAIRGPPPVVNDDESESEESGSEKRPPRPSTDTGGWYAESSEDEDAGPQRTTGVGLRNPKNHSLPRIQAHDEDSEEDVPLAATIDRALQRTTRLVTADDSDEEKPLSALMDKAKLKLPAIDFDNLSPSSHPADDDDDDQPLGLRASRLVPNPSSAPDAEDDDKPLAFHPEQQRRTQYQMMAAQQQMMMQAQMHNSMFFNPSMMGSGFFPPPMAMPMVPQAPIPVPSPPPVHDAAKYGRVDRWRHDVAIEGES